MDEKSSSRKSSVAGGPVSNLNEGVRSLAFGDRGGCGGRWPIHLVSATVPIHRSLIAMSGSSNKVGHAATASVRRWSLRPHPTGWSSLTPSISEVSSLSSAPSAASLFADSFAHLAHNRFIAANGGKADRRCEPPAGICPTAGRLPLRVWPQVSDYKYFDYKQPGINEIGRMPRLISIRMRYLPPKYGGSGGGGA